MIVADIAAQFDGYWGDMTRCRPRRPAERLGGQRLGRRQGGLRRRGRGHARSATRPRDVDAAQRAIVEAHPEIGACLHGAGHAIGTEIHEPPFLVATSRRRRCARA